MRLAYGVFILILSAIVILPKPALAQNATTLQVSAPSSVKMDDSFTVAAYYASNGTNVCGATCEVKGGWLTSTIYLGEGSGCIYENDISAYGTPESYSLSVNCYKQFYDSQTKYFNIEITSKSSSLHFSLNPPSPYPGDSVTVYAYYRDEGGSLIGGASCTADLKMGGVEYQRITMVPSDSTYYSGTFKVPNQYGTYDVSVTCISSEYAAASSAKSFATAKKRASLSVSVPPSGYYGEAVKVTAYYKDAQEGKKIPGTCRTSFEGSTSVLNSVDSSYEGFVNIPYKAGTTTVKVTCESSEYETLEASKAISAANRPTGIEAVSPSQYTNAVFYPTDEIQMKISYSDLLSSQPVAGAICVAEAGGKTYPLAGSGKYYEGRLSSQPLGQQTVKFKCSKTFYESKEGSIGISVNRIPIDIILVSPKKEFRKGEAITIIARVVDKDNKDANASCRIRADVYDLSFNKLIESRNIEETMTGDGFRTLNIPNPGSPSRIRVTMTCSGDIFEEKSVYTDVKIEMLGKQTEEGMTLFLAITTVLLLALTFLIRKKLKII
jgi:hypothetical protein